MPDSTKRTESQVIALMAGCGHTEEFPHRWVGCFPHVSDRCQRCGQRYGSLPVPQWHEFDPER